MRLAFGPVTLVSTAKVEGIEHERDQWKLRTNQLADRVAALEREQRGLVDARPRPRRTIWATTLTVCWLLVAGLFIGVMVPKAQGPTVLPDAGDCISQARYEHPVEGNQYQELVNALWTCEVYQ